MPLDIETLLAAEPSQSVARQLIEWAAATRNQIARGDMIIPASSHLKKVGKIPAAYQTAADYGRSDAWLALAWWHANPQFGEPDLMRAEAALQAAIDADVPTARLELVKIRWFFKRDISTPSEQREAYEIASKIVEGDPNIGEAVYFLALLTTHGFGVSASPERGFKLLQRASDLGNVDAMFELYIHYASGLGVATDEAAALRACRQAAEAGHPRAMYNMGAYNASGRGMPKSIPEAIKWYERAADVGNPSAMVGLAVIYATGDGVKPDREHARQLFDRADYCGLDVSHIRKQVGL